MPDEQQPPLASNVVVIPGRRIKLRSSPLTVEEVQDALIKRNEEKKRELTRKFEFPQTAFQGLLGRWATFMAQGTIIAPEYLYMCGLTYLGATLKETVGLMSGEEG